MDDVLLCKIEGKVATMEINRPPYNPLNPAVFEKMIGFLEELYRNEEAHVLVIKGTGEKAFSAGADINQFVPRLGSKDISLTAGFHKAFELLTQLSIPVIAALKGHVLGGGLELALACDFRICDENTKMGLPEVNLGLFPGAGGTQRLPRLIGKSKAMEMIMFGTPIEAEEAKQLGLVNKVVPAGLVEEEAMSWANTLKEKPRVAIQKIKKTIQHGSNLPLSEGLRYEMEMFAEMFVSEDTTEGVTAFLEKRKPNFNRI
ncbi:enoyl-CoA hydratase-related protein [Mesobacillus maritimus]|uniref:enoyl-CoA hydratase/isomerase family protein n=1 Tax=Mesobacillus maritimus TaxID=1643336 RepID=UPI00203E7F4F|nr:enoyl-CoA hydratase-related protein [Mesobacillus maritimus]MCM3584169.1 enoyl-CoA hydratase-related protein [Mesobacillus maritimus]